MDAMTRSHEIWKDVAAGTPEVKKAPEMLDGAQEDREESGGERSLVGVCAVRAKNSTGHDGTRDGRFDETSEREQ